MQHQADSRYAALRLAITLALMTIGSVGMYVVPVVLPAVQADFGVARADASLPYTLLMVGFDRPAWDISCFYPVDAYGKTTDPRIAVGEANYRTFPSTLDSARYPDLHLMDVGLAKTFHLPRNVDLQLRIEAINTLNYTVWFDPDTNPRSSTFGYFRSQRNNPRDFQIGAKISF